MSRVIDALVAYRVLKLLITPFNKTEAFKLGIIDDKGKVLIKSKEIKNKFYHNNETHTHFSFVSYSISKDYYQKLVFDCTSSWSSCCYCVFARTIRRPTK